MKHIAQFDLSTQTVMMGIQSPIWETILKLDTAQGSIFRARFYNDSPINLILRFGDQRSSYDFLPARTSKYYEILISSSRFAFAVCSSNVTTTALGVTTPGITTQNYMLHIVQYDTDEEVFDKSTHILSDNKIIQSYMQTVEFTGAAAPSLTISNFSNGAPGLFYYADGFDLSVLDVTTAANLVIKLQDDIGSNLGEWDFRLLTTGGAFYSVRFPYKIAPVQGDAIHFVSTLSANFGAQNQKLVIYYHLETGSNFILPQL